MSEELERRWQAVVAKAEADEGYKKRLHEDTLQVLIDEGWDVSNWSRAEVRLNRNGALSLWTNEVGQHVLSDEDLDSVSGGVTKWNLGGCSACCDESD